MAVLVYKCPNCDAGLVFDPDSQKFHCEYCMSYFSQQDLEKPENAAPKETPPANKAHEELHTVVYSCPTCGAEIATDETTAATFCFYCHNPVVLSSRLEGYLKPDKVVPFTIDKEQAVQGLLSWTRKKRFVPEAFFSASQIEKVTGVYFPYWMVDGQIHGTLMTGATNIRVWRVGNTEFIETTYYNVKREGDADFKEYAKNALRKESGRLVDRVHPYDMSAAKDFSSAYLSGFQAEKRNIERSDCEDEVRGELDGYSQSMLADSISGYTGTTPGSFNSGRTDLKWSYTLVPAWVLTYRGNDRKTYYYTMNGQSGKASGVLPVSMKKLLLSFAGISCALFLILMTGSYFL